MPASTCTGGRSWGSRGWWDQARVGCLCGQATLDGANRLFQFLDRAVLDSLIAKGHALLAEYASETDSVGIGNTGGGVQIEGWDEEPYLTWEDFSTDLRLAWQTGKPVHIFSLEGCVRQGFLDRLITFDWNQAVPTQPDTNPVKLMRKGLQTLLWAVQRPWVILAGLSALVGGLLFRKGSNKKN